MTTQIQNLIDPLPEAVEGVAFVDGRFMPLAQATISVVDRGFVRSDATYDVVHVRHGNFFRLHDHIERFFWSMSQLRMSLPYTPEQVAQILADCVRRSGLQDAYVQMTCTRGVPPQGSRDPRLCRNRFLAFAQPFVWIANESQQEEGIAMIVSQVQRIPSQSIDTRIKNFHWLDLTMGILEAYDQGALVSVLVDNDANITEGAGFNVFSVRRGRLATPAGNVFEGMTRRTVIEMATQLGLTCDVRPVGGEELASSDEIFITSTAGGIMPVIQINGKPVGQGVPGPLTARIKHEYWHGEIRKKYSSPVSGLQFSEVA